MKIASGAGLVAIAIRQRRRMGQPNKPPKWQEHVDSMSRVRRGPRRTGKLLHHKTASKLEEQAGATIPVGGAGLIVAYPHSAAAKVEPA